MNAQNSCRRIALPALMLLAAAGAARGQGTCDPATGCHGCVNAHTVGHCQSGGGSVCILGEGSGGAAGVGDAWCLCTGGTWYPDTACPHQYASMAPPQPILDSPAPNVPGPAASVTIMVPDDFAIGAVGVSLLIAHPRQGDLSIALTHVETGTSVILMDRPGYPQIQPFGFTAAGFGASTTSKFTVSDGGAAPYDVPAVPPPGINAVTGTWRSEQSMASLLGQRSLGTWRVSVVDSSPGATGTLAGVTLSLSPGGSTCYANCDGSTVAPVLNVADFSCFLGKFAAGDPYANCDGSTTAPVLNVADFTCFLTKFAAGCGPG